MRKEVLQFIHKNPEVKQFIRENPIWYRYLSRNPQALVNLENELKVYYGRTLPQKLDRFQSNLNMALMLLDMVRGMGTAE